MYLNIGKITINQKKYYVHRLILEQFDYFNAIFKGNFFEKDINLDFEDDIDTNLILDVSYQYYYSNKFLNTTLTLLENKTFADAVKIFCTIEYLQPTNNILTSLIDSYCMPCKILTIEYIMLTNLSNKYKRLLLQQYIYEVNNVTLTLLSSDKQHMDISSKRIKLDCIKEFFQQFNIELTTYELVYEKTTYGPLIINDKMIKIDGRINYCISDEYLTETLINFFIDEYIII